MERVETRLSLGFPIVCLGGVALRFGLVAFQAGRLINLVCQNYKLLAVI